VTVLGSYDGIWASRILLIAYVFLVTAQDAGRPSPPAPLPEGEGRFYTFGVYFSEPELRFSACFRISALAFCRRSGQTN
jgi:hypothetical protein